jgi:hypothetical protein
VLLAPLRRSARSKRAPHSSQLNDVVVIGADRR